MRKYPLGYAELDQYDGLTEEEILAWNHPDRTTYHHVYLERMGADIFRLRDSREPFIYIGSSFELAQHLWSHLTLRELDPSYGERVTALRILNQQEVDDLFKDL